MSITTPGIGSGLDVKALVDALVKAEITPAQTRHDTNLKSVNTELSAIGQLKSTLYSLQSSLNTLSNRDNLYTMQSSVSTTDFLSATIGAQAIKGAYQIEVRQMAQQQTLATDYIADPTSLGSGTMTINFGTYNADKTVFTANSSATPITVTIPSDSDSLVAVCNAINEVGGGVTASIVQDDLGSRLTLVSKNTGENYSMQVLSSIGALNYDPTTSNTTLTETIAAQNSIVKINGLTLTQSTNQLQNAISGVTINLKQAEIGTLTTLNISDNQNQLTSFINDFVKKYNDSITFLTNLTGYNMATKQGGLFQSDPQFRNLKLNLNKWATTPLTNTNSSIKSLADLGITTNAQGLLTVDSTKFNSVLSSNYADIGALFAKTASITDSNIRLKSLSSDVPAGTYDIALNSYTPGVSMSGTIGSLTATSPDGIALYGTGTLSGLSVNVLSGSTGSRGQITVQDGLAVQINRFLDTYMDIDGDFDQRTEQLNEEVTQLAKVQEQIDFRVSNLNNRYTKQFNSLDVLLTQMQSTSSFLTQQLARLTPQKK